MWTANQNNILNNTMVNFFWQVETKKKKDVPTLPCVGLAHILQHKRGDYLTCAWYSAHLGASTERFTDSVIEQL
jgi:hypothetical protein